MALSSFHLHTHTHYTPHTTHHTPHTTHHTPHKPHPHTAWNCPCTQGLHTWWWLEWNMNISQTSSGRSIHEAGASTNLQGSDPPACHTPQYHKQHTTNCSTTTTCTKHVKWLLYTPSLPGFIESLFMSTCTPWSDRVLYGSLLVKGIKGLAQLDQINFLLLGSPQLTNGASNQKNPENNSTERGVAWGAST